MSPDRLDRPAASARVATSLLAAAGLEDLATPDRESYIARAVELARVPERAQALRERVRAARRSPLFDARSRVRDIEAAYRRPPGPGMGSRRRPSSCPETACREVLHRPASPLAPAPQIGNSSWTDAALAAILCA